MAQLQSTGITGSFVIPGQGGIITNTAAGKGVLGTSNTGIRNTAFGYNAMNTVTTGARNVCIGFGAGSNITTQTNVICLGSGSKQQGSSNSVVLGNPQISSLYCQVTGITTLSDFRDKTDINNFEIGLSFIEKLRPVTFKWDNREWYSTGAPDGSKKDDKVQVGFIAQELKQLQEEFSPSYLMVATHITDNDTYYATPSNLLTPVIKAIQEQSAELKSLKIQFGTIKNILSSSLNL